MKKILIPLIIIVFLVYGIYNFYHEDKISYVALGDSLAAGENPYGEIGYGYADYVSDYLKSKNLLKSYTKGYAKSGDTTNDLLDKITKDIEVNINDEKVCIKKALRESNLVTISIGANDLIQSLDFKDIMTMGELDYSKIGRQIELITKDVDNVVAEVKKYAKGNIILVGYYNPINKNIVDNEKIDELIDKTDKLFTQICAKEKIKYVKISDLFKNSEEYLPNPLNIHPNYKGYEQIADRIIKEI